MSKTKYFVIIPAAGIGSRFQSHCPKQYLKLNNQIILEHVVNLFSSLNIVEKVVVALHADDQWWPTLQLSHPQKVMTVVGGKKRAHSVLLGLNFLTNFADKNDWVLVHDAARPYIQTEDITRLLFELKNHDVGGLLGLPIVDTVKCVDENNAVIKTVPRDQLWQAQTPQCFRYELLKSAIEKALLDNKIITDESSAIEYAGFKPKMIAGNVNNKKITFAGDL